MIQYNINFPSIWTQNSSNTAQDTLKIYYYILVVFRLFSGWICFICTNHEPYLIMRDTHLVLVWPIGCNMCMICPIAFLPFGVRVWPCLSICLMGSTLGFNFGLVSNILQSGPYLILSVKMLIHFYVYYTGR